MSVTTSAGERLYSFDAIRPFLDRLHRLYRSDRDFDSRIYQESPLGAASMLAKYTGCKVDTEAQAIRRGMKGGGIRLHVADRWADALGYHPVNIWGDEWLVGAED